MLVKTHWLKVKHSQPTSGWIYLSLQTYALHRNRDHIFLINLIRMHLTQKFCTFSYWDRQCSNCYLDAYDILVTCQSARRNLGQFLKVWDI